MAEFEENYKRFQTKKSPSVDWTTIGIDLCQKKKQKQKKQLA